MEQTSVTAGEYLERFAERRPQIIWLFGTTSVGKSFFSRVLSEHYALRVIDLDQMVKAEIIDYFGLPEAETYQLVNKGAGEPQWVDHYIEKVHEAIDDALTKSGAVCECPIKHIPTLHRILDVYHGKYEFVVLYPDDRARYVDRLAQRIKNHREGNAMGLPANFWSMVASDDKEKFFSDHVITETMKEYLAAYADRQMQRSQEFLSELHTSFDVTIVRV